MDAKTICFLLIILLFAETGIGQGNEMSYTPNHLDQERLTPTGSNFASLNTMNEESGIYSLVGAYFSPLCVGGSIGHFRDDQMGTYLFLRTAAPMEWQGYSIGIGATQSLIPAWLYLKGGLGYGTYEDAYLTVEGLEAESLLSLRLGMLYAEAGVSVIDLNDVYVLFGIGVNFRGTRWI
jgi:hypothetical protein